MDLSIIIVNYKTKDVTSDCLQAVFASQTSFTYEVIVVDNHSEDDSVPSIRKRFPQVTIIERQSNDGFAVANNRGVAHASGKYVWLLNSDTLIYPDTIQKLMECVTKHGSSIASCRLLNQDTTIQPQGGALPTLTNLTLWMFNLDGIAQKLFKTQSYQNRDLAWFTKNQQGGWLGGTALIVRRDLYQAMHGLDERIFMYGEDVEFCLRAQKQGIETHYFANPQLIHLGQASSGKERPVLGEFKGLKYIYKKHRTLLAYIYLRVILKLGAVLRFVMYALKGQQERRKTYAKAFFLA